LWKKPTRLLAEKFGEWVLVEEWAKLKLLEWAGR
jgi:hypothetical protein